MTELESLAERLSKATSYTDIFTDPDTIDSDFRRLARIAHPDGKTGADLGVATYAYQLLSKFKVDADRKIIATITTRKAKHEIRKLWGQGDLASLYLTDTVIAHDGDFYPTNGLLKVARSPRDNDLLAQEARALKTLHDSDDQLTRHFPRLLDTFLHSEGKRRSNVLTLLHGHYTLQQVYDAFPSGLDPAHGVWMFRRLLMALGFAHERGLVHGAVVPTHVMIEPSQHAVMLIDWCYSQVIDSESETNFIKAVVPMYESFYPEEVGAKQAPNAATDIYMTTRLMSWLMPVAPKPLRNFFKGCALTKQTSRPQNAWLLLKEFDDLLKTIGEPFYPKRFVEFAVPVGSA